MNRLPIALLVLLVLAPLAQAQTNRPSGRVVAWGNNNAGETNVPLAAESGVVAIAAGAHSVALKTNGTVVAWGDNCCGQTDVPVAAQSGVVAIAAGLVHTLALKSDGSVVAWGVNGSGQTDVPVAARSGVVAIATGRVPVAESGYIITLKTNGAVLSWGVFGQETVPVGLPPAIAIAAGSSGFTLALARDPATSLTLLRNADQTLNLSRSGSGVLEQTESLIAPNWQPAPSQANPQIIGTTNAMRFYRITE